MWYSDIQAQRASNMHTPRLDRRPLQTHLERGESPDIEKLDLSTFDDDHVITGNPETSTQRDRSVLEDDRRSKITVVSLKSNRTSRTVQTLPSVLESHRKQDAAQAKPSKAKAAIDRAKKTVSTGLRESSIKRIIAASLTIVTFLMLLLGIFLPFWNVYKTTDSNGVTVGHYGGLWSYCEAIKGGSTACSTYNEANNAHWFRACRFFEMMAFLGVTCLLVLMIAYMFCLREIKYAYLQWVIIGLCFGVGCCAFIGLIIFGAGYSTSSHISSAFGITFCGFACSIVTGGIFLWDKLDSTDADSEKEKKTLQFRGMSGAQSSRMRVSSRMSQGTSARGGVNGNVVEGGRSVHAVSMKSGANSQRSLATNLTKGTFATQDSKRTGPLMKRGLKPIQKNKLNTSRKF